MLVGTASFEEVDFVFADDEDGTGGVADDAFGGAAHEEALEAGAAMGADDKKVSVLFSGCLGDFAKWNSRADTDFCGVSDLDGLAAKPPEVFEERSDLLFRVLLESLDCDGISKEHAAFNRAVLHRNLDDMQQIQ